MEKTEIKKTILKATGNPESGAIKDNLELIANALYEALNKSEEKHYKPNKEVRVTKVSETR
jgi:hypothetical protein